MSKYNLNNKNVIITGASSGFGKLIATRLATEYSCKVIGIARNEEKLIKAKQEIGENFTYSAFDVGVKDNWTAFSEKLAQTDFRPDVLVNNAGVLPKFSKFEHFSDSEVENVMQTNFFSSIYSINALLPVLSKSRSGAIINVSSSASLATVIGTSVYSASKSALKSLTESLMLEHPEMYVALVLPGFAKTDIFRSQSSNDHDDKLISKVCSAPEKFVGSILSALKRRKKRIVLGADAKAMDFFYRIMPLTTNKLIARVLKKANVEVFNDVFTD